MPRKPATPTTALRLAGVKRVSRRNDRSGPSFMSDTDQDETIRMGAQMNGATVVAMFDETDSVSGKTTDREGLQAAIAMCLRGEADGVIVAKVDRLARNAVEGLLAVRELRRAGKAFIAVKDGVSSEERTGQLLLTILLALAEWQLEALTEQWDGTVERHVANGVANKVAWGYLKDPTTRRLVVDRDKAKWVKRAFELRAAGKSWIATANALTAEGAPTNGDRWLYTRVRGMVTNRVYLGELRIGEYVNLTAHEAIVGIDLWERANRAPATATRCDSGFYVLAGIVRCAGCGGRMRGESSTPKGAKRPYRYYKCRRQYSWGVCPSPASVDADALEEEALRRFFEVAALTGTPSASTDELEAAAAEMADAEADLKAFLESPETDKMRRALGDEWVATGQAARVARVVDARETVAKVRSDLTGLALPVTLEEDWPDMEPDEQRGFLSDVFGVVAVRRVQHRADISARARFWTTDDPSTPTGLPSRGADGNCLRAIDF